MTVEQTVAKLEERLNSHDKRIEKNENILSQIHKLTAITENLTTEVKAQGERIEKIAVNFEARMKAQGERIGELEKRGSKRLESIAATAATVLITAVIVYFLGRFGLDAAGLGA